MAHWLTRDNGVNVLLLLCYRHAIKAVRVIVSDYKLFSLYGSFGCSATFLKMANSLVSTLSWELRSILGREPLMVLIQHGPKPYKKMPYRKQWKHNWKQNSRLRETGINPHNQNKVILKSFEINHQTSNHWKQVISVLRQFQWWNVCTQKLRSH